MEEYQRQALLKSLDRLIQSAEDEEFELLDDMRSALKKWDLQGPIPYEAELRAHHIDLEFAFLSPNAEEVRQILKALQERLKATAAVSSQYEQLNEVRRAVKDWSESGCQGALPHAEELAAWGIWPPAVSDPDAELLSEYEMAHALMATQLYQAKQRLNALQERARGRLVESIAADLADAEVELQRGTKARIAAVREVQREKPGDLDAQVRAWREVTAFNPESLEAQAELQALQVRVQKALEAEMKSIEAAAREAAAADHLPDLQAARGEAEALAARADLPEELRVAAEKLKTDVLAWLAQTRERLNQASTLAVQGNLREAYQDARDKLDRNIPMLVDAGGLLGSPDQEVYTRDFFRVVGGQYVSAISALVEGRLESARATKSSDPEKALADLKEAGGWLQDEIWTTDHRRSLRPQLDEIGREIQDVERLLVHFKEAREKVEAARAVGIAARERLDLLNEAQQLYPNYPQIEAYLGEARDNLAGELAGEVEAQVVEAHRLMGDEKFDEALKILKQAREAALRDVPAPKADSRLAQALAHVAQEEAAVVGAEKDWHHLEVLLKQVDEKLMKYVQDKEPGLLDEARALLEQVSPAWREHPSTQVLRGRLAAQQGDADNFLAGKKAYEDKQWAAAEGYFDKVRPAYADYAEAQRLHTRAMAMWAVEDGQRAEKEGDWQLALGCYVKAVAWLEEAGEDALTLGVTQVYRDKRDKISSNDRKFREPLNEAKTQLEQAQRGVLAASAPLRDRLDPIPQFAAIVTKLEPLLKEPSVLVEDIKIMLRDVRKQWREAYVPALGAVRDAVREADMSEEVLKVACERARELKEAGLLYVTDEERLYFELEGCRLDAAYRHLRAAESPKWEEIEQNRQERQALRLVEQPDSIREELAEARRQRVENEIRKVREEKGAEAARRWLSEQVRSGKLPADAQWLQMWVELCWETGAWDEADVAVARLAEARGDLQERRNQASLWRGLTNAARAYAEDDIEGGRRYIQDLKNKKLSDSVIQEQEQELERTALGRLLNRAEGKRRDFAGRNAPARPEEYYQVARDYGLVLQLDPQNPVAKGGLKEISSNIVPIVRQLSVEARSLVIGGDVKRACEEAGRLLNELNAFETIVNDLNLPGDVAQELKAAQETLSSKKGLWEEAAAQLEQSKRAVCDALAYPAPLREDNSEDGGWDFSEAKKLLDNLWSRAVKEKDYGLQDLLRSKREQLDLYEKEALDIMEGVRRLLGAICKEDFESVIREADALKPKWEKLRHDDAGWDGLDSMVRYLYKYPALHEGRSLREHREFAEKQRNNAREWKAYEREVSQLYEKLQDLEHELEGEFDSLVREKSLHEIKELCEGWQAQCEKCLKQLGNEPEEGPLSARAATAWQRVDRVRQYLNVKGGAREKVGAMKAAAAYAEEDLQSHLRRLRNFYNGLSDAAKTGRKPLAEEQRRLACDLYHECQKRDPQNAEVRTLRKKFEQLGVDFPKTPG